MSLTGDVSLTISFPALYVVSGAHPTLDEIGVPIMVTASPMAIAKRSESQGKKKGKRTPGNHTRNADLAASVTLTFLQ
jgi:hypothetical protein